jgi:hypothetical protein
MNGPVSTSLVASPPPPAPPPAPADGAPPTPVDGDPGHPDGSGSRPRFTDVLSDQMSRSAHRPPGGRGPSVHRSTTTAPRGARTSSSPDHPPGAAPPLTAGSVPGPGDGPEPPGATADDPAVNGDDALLPDAVSPSDAGTDQPPAPVATGARPGSATDPTGPSGTVDPGTGSDPAGEAPPVPTPPNPPTPTNVASGAASTVVPVPDTAAGGTGRPGRPAGPSPDRAPDWGGPTPKAQPASGPTTPAGTVRPPMAPSPPSADRPLDPASAAHEADVAPAPASVGASQAKPVGPAAGIPPTMNEQLSEGLDVDGLAGSISRPLSNGDGSYTVTVAMHPPELGHLQAVMSLDGDDLQVSITPQGQAGHDALARALHDLRDQLAGGGVNVSVTLRDPSSQSGGDDPHPSPAPDGPDAPGPATTATPVAAGSTSGQIHLVL